ncbi:LysR family transcriptional regulator [Dactylosporangium sp. CA-139066]|uniref:LysR family transcriptional regulator n=1 Tax=Dactylosporangium sp. CA-139066 TaxID=3239930 RepID=UPI003D92F656
MQTEMLEVFREVANQRSITGAAATLRYTQSAVSRQMAALEAEFGARLFDRLPRGVALTEEGRCLLAHAEAVLDRLAAARREVHAVRDAVTGRLRVGAFATADAAVVPRAMSRFRAEHPAVEVSLVEGLTMRLLSALLAGDADVVLVNTSADRPFTDDRFGWHHLADEPVLLAVRADHRLAARAGRRPGLRAGGPPGAHAPVVRAARARAAGADDAPAGRGAVVRWADLAGEPWVAGSLRPAETLLGASARLGFEPRIEFVVREWTAKFGFVAAGLGVTLVPALAAAVVPAGLRLLPLDPAEFPPRLIQAATLAGRTVPATVARFLAILQDETVATLRHVSPPGPSKLP